MHRNTNTASLSIRSGDARTSRTRRSALGATARAGKLRRRPAAVLARPCLGVAADRAAVELVVHPVRGLPAALAGQAAEIADAAEARRLALRAESLQALGELEGKCAQDAHAR